MPIIFSGIWFLARVGEKVVELARNEGIKLGCCVPLRYGVPTKEIQRLAKQVKAMSLKLSAGQMVETFVAAWHVS